MFFDSSAFLFQGTVNQINSSVYTGNGLQLFALVEYAFPVFFYLHGDDSTLFWIENAEVPVRSFLNLTPSRLYICTLPLGEEPVTATVMWYMPALSVSDWISSLLHEAANKQAAANNEWIFLMVGFFCWMLSDDFLFCLVCPGWRNCWLFF